MAVNWTWEIPLYYTEGVKKKFLQISSRVVDPDCVRMLTWNKEEIMKINFWDTLSNLCISIYLYIYISIYLSIYQSIYLSIYLSIYISIYLWIDVLLKSIMSLTFKCHVYNGPRTLGQNLKCFKTISSFSLKPWLHRV